MSAPVGSTTLGGGDAGHRHPLAGFASVDESARLVRNYRYAVERMTRILGGWIALTPELSAKLLLGRHVWDNAQHADALGKRLPELRARAQESEPANAAVVAFMSAIEEPDQPGQTVERLVGIYRVLKPHLLASYEEGLRRVNRVYEPPTERILDRLAADERRHIAAGLTVLPHVAPRPEHAERARAWQARLEALLASAGGVTGEGMPAPASLDEPPATTASDAAAELIGLERRLERWPMPEALERALAAFGDGLVSGDAAAVARWLVPGSAVPGESVAGLAELGVERHRVVAFAKIGDKRLVKLRLDGRRGALTLLARWAPTAAGWCVETAEVTALEPARSA